MKIAPRLVTVCLSSDDGDAILKFERFRKNERLKMQVDLSKKESLSMEVIQDYWKAVMGKCIEVQNLSEGDRAVTVEDVREMRLYEDIIQLIHDAYWKVINDEEVAKLPTPLTQKEQPQTDASSGV